MRNVCGVVITDLVEEAMLDAIDKFGIISYELYDSVNKVMFVVMCSSKAAGLCDADVYLKERCPDWNWVVVAEEWLERDAVHTTPVFMGGGWVSFG